MAAAAAYWDLVGGRASGSGPGFGDLIKNLKPYYQRRRLKRLARRKQAARAAAAAKKPVLVKAEPAVQETARVPVPQKIARWLEKNRLFGT